MGKLHSLHWDLCHEKKVIKLLAKGEITSHSFIIMWLKMLELKEFSCALYHVLMDFGEAELSMSYDEVNGLKSFFSSHLALQQYRRLALVTQHPRSSALLMLMQKNVFQDTGSQVQIFFGNEEAHIWVAGSDGLAPS